MYNITTKRQALLNRARARLQDGSVDECIGLCRQLLEDVFRYRLPGSYNRLKESLQISDEGKVAFELLICCLRLSGARLGWLYADTLRIRSGLSYMREKLFSRPSKIAYVGASVTGQKDSYVKSLHAGLCELTGFNHDALIVGRGATGSIYALESMDTEILRHRPEMCFFEYLTGDLNEGLTPWAEMERVLETVIHDLMAHGCRVIFLYLFRGDYLLHENNKALRIYEAAAEKFGVPSINGGLFLQQIIVNGAISYFDLIRDAVHTTPLGSEIVGRYLVQRVNELLLSGGELISCAANHGGNNRFKRVRLIEPRVLGVAQRRTWKGKTFVHLDSDTAEVEWTTQGYLLGVSVVVGPLSGAVEVLIGEEVRIEVLWDHWCRNGGERFRLVPIGVHLRVPARVVIRIKRYPILPCGFCYKVEPTGEVYPRHATHPDEFVIRYECPCSEMDRVVDAYRTASIVGLVVDDQFGSS